MDSLAYPVAGLICLGSLVTSWFFGENPAIRTSCGTVAAVCVLAAVVVGTKQYLFSDE